MAVTALAKPLTERPTGDTDSCSLIIFDRSGSQVAVLCHDGCRTLPEINLPCYSRKVEQINAWVFRNCGITTVSLFSWPISAESHGHYYFALEALPCCNEVPGLEWRHISEVASLLPAEQMVVVHSCHAQLDTSSKDPGERPFERIGWIHALHDWVRRTVRVDRVISTAHLGGSHETCLIRFEVPEKTLWYKAVGRATPREFVNVMALSKWLPQYLPAVLASDRDRSAWLMESGGATTLGEQPDFDTWLMVARQLGDFQKNSISHTCEFLELGCVDLRTEALVDLIEPYFASMDMLMRQQTKEVPEALTTSQLKQLAQGLDRTLNEVATLDLPDAIGNSDFNPGNILISSSGAKFIDWQVGHVGSPVLTLEYLIAHFAKMCPERSTQKHLLREAYFRAWQSAVPAQIMRKALEVGPLIAVYASAIASNTWRTPDRLAIPRIAGYQRSLVRIMHREALMLSERGLLA